MGAGAGLIFKGTGFYITDYKNKPDKPVKKEGGDKPAAPTADKKPAATSPAG